MSGISYIAIALVLVMLNEYRLITKYIKALSNNEQKKTKLQRFFELTIKPFVNLGNWINYKLLNNELEN
jgi:hypothetical protein